MTDIEPQDQQGQEQWKAHPSWDGVLEMFPEGPQREALIHQIRESDVNAQKAIEQARAQAAPEDWRELMEAAQAAELTPQDLGEAYQQLDTMREQIANDPDAWLTDMRASIDEAVAAGQITRKQGADLKNEAVQTAAASGSTGGEDLADLDDPRLAALQKKVEDQDRRWQQQEQERQREEEERAQQEADAETQRLSQEFVETFEGAFNEQEVLRDVEPKTRYIVANHALNLMMSNDNMTPREAADAAISEFQERFGLPKTPTAGGPVPIGGGSNQLQQGGQVAGSGTLRGVDKARTQAMEAELARMQAAGIQ